MQEWYLLSQNTRPNVTGGFENDMFVENKDDAFAESLETDIAVSVILYNSDLSKGKNIRCIVQGNTADTQLKSLERTVLFSIGTVKAGMYVFFENRYWLINGYPGNNGIYEKATMVLCQYLLRWQNSEGKIIERWCNAVSASKYDVGENGNYTILLSHRPEADHMLSHGDADIVISGHTHGGQIRLPFNLLWFEASPEHAQPYTYPWHISGGNTYLITKGLGTSTLPLRFNCPPEIYLLELH